MAGAKPRPVYAALNPEKTDMGFAALGTVSAVFRTSYLADMTLVSAVDTGWFENVCNRTDPNRPPPAGMANCSAWDHHTFGTLHPGSFDHILLGNAKCWEPSGWSLPRLFRRMFGAK